MLKNAPQICYELTTIFRIGEFVAKGFEPFKTLDTNYRLTKELQELSTEYRIQFRTSQTDCVPATNPKICRFVAIPGIRGLYGIWDKLY